MNRLQSRLVHASAPYNVIADKVLLRSEIGFEELVDTLKITLDPEVLGNKLWGIKLNCIQDENARVIITCAKDDEQEFLNILDSDKVILVDTASDEPWKLVAEKLSEYAKGDITLLSLGNTFEFLFTDITFNTENPINQVSYLSVEEIVVRNSNLPDGLTAEYIHYEFLNYRMKVGDGKRPYSVLPYFGSVSVTSGNSQTGGGEGAGLIYQSELQTTDISDAQVIEAATQDANLHHGDLFVVVRQINDTTEVGQGVTAHSQRTAYYYNSKLGNPTWVALDGNYDARTIIIPENITITSNFGVNTIPSTGNLVLPSKGKTLFQFLQENLAARITTGLASGSAKIAPKCTKKYIPVGGTADPVTITMEPSVTNSYTYGYQLENGEVYTTGTIGTIGSFTQCSTSGGTYENISNQNGKAHVINSYSTASYGSHTHYFKAEYDYPEGAVPLDNLGSPINDSTEVFEDKTLTGSCEYACIYEPVYKGMINDPVNWNGSTTEDAIISLIKGTVTGNTAAMRLYYNTNSYSASHQYNKYIPTSIDVGSGYTCIAVAIPTSYGKSMINANSGTFTISFSAINNVELNGLLYNIYYLLTNDTMDVAITNINNPKS